MNAWLITWEYLGEHAASHQRFIAILSSRKHCSTVAEFVEFHYGINNLNATEMSYYANRRRELPFIIKNSAIINDVPHADRITCGDNPHIYARKVSELTISRNNENNSETVRWKEPKNMEWKDKNKLEVLIGTVNRYDKLIHKCSKTV